MPQNNTQNTDVPMKRTYLVEEIASILGIGRSSAYELVKQGHFKIVRIGTAIRISKKSFDEWLDSQEISS
jgi:excisionase family DNA binding protein